MAKRKSHLKDPCTTPGCNGDNECPESGLCKRCYNFLYYWHRRGVTAKVKHVKKLEQWDQRAQALLLPTNVSSISRQGRKRSAG